MDETRSHNLLSVLRLPTVLKGKCLAGQWLVEADVNNKVPWIIGVPLKHVTANTDTLSDSR